MKLLPLLIQVFFITLLSKTVTSCPPRDQFKDCADPDNYFNTYGEVNCTRFNMADGLEAQWTFIYNKDVGLREEFRPYLNNDSSNADEFSDTIKSLIELHRTIERYTTSTSQSDDVGHQLARAVARQSCEWLNQVGILRANCNDSQNYLPLLEVIHARLDLHDKIKDSRNSFKSLYNTPTYRVNYCAWLNDRVLGNCQDSQSNSTTTRDTLAKICHGRCHRRRNTMTTINLCSA